MGTNLEAELEKKIEKFRKEREQAPAPNEKNEFIALKRMNLRYFPVSASSSDSEEDPDILPITASKSLMALDKLDLSYKRSISQMIMKKQKEVERDQE